jgi:hypothetical protein
MGLEDGRIAHAVLSYGGWLGIGETHAAVPWKAMEPMVETDDPRMILEITQERLRQAPEYNMEGWPQHDDGAWAQDLVREPEPMRPGERQPRHPRQPTPR